MNRLFSLKDIILTIVNSFSEKKILLGKTRLAKIAYLLELEYFKASRERLTDAKWIFYKFGPYPVNFNDYLKQSDIDIQEEDNFFKISTKEDIDLPEIPLVVKTLLNKIIMEYGEMSINELLNYVYFETEPMSYAKPKEELDFSRVPVDEDRKKDISIFISNENRNKIFSYRDKMSEKLEQHSLLKFKALILPENIFEDSDINPSF